MAVSGLSPEILPPTHQAACGPFTPNKSGQRLRSLYHRCCWHRVSNLLFFRYRQHSSLKKAVYEPKPFILHAASLPQPFGHWGRFSTAATRRCLGSVSVPVRGVVLSHPLSVIALVSHYLTNKLIDHRPLSKHRSIYIRRLESLMTIGN